jgi:hypothetical protein
MNLYKKRYSAAEWETILQSFPENVTLAQLPTGKEQSYRVEHRNSIVDAKCAACKAVLRDGDLQVTTDGPYRTIMRHWITRTFFFCPKLRCISAMPRNSFIQPYNPSTMSLQFDSNLSLEQKQLLGVS